MRWPPLNLTRETQCFKEQIFKERAHGRPITSSASMSSSGPGPTPYAHSGPGSYAYRPIVSTRQQPFGQRTPAAPPTPLTIVLPSDRPFNQFGPSVTTLSMQRPTCSAREMTEVKNWHAPPLVMSPSFSGSEPRGFFSNVLERSTMSVASPAAPLVPWKVRRAACRALPPARSRPLLPRVSSLTCWCRVAPTPLSQVKFT